MPTKIPWVRNPDGSAGETWNPVRGCEPVSSGCANCYAGRMASRFAWPGGPYEGLARGGKWTGGISVVPRLLGQPYRWRKPRSIFVNSMSDLFHNGVSFTLLNEIFETMRATPRHRYMILTKRPERMLKFVRHYNETVGRSHRMPFPNVWLGVSVENQSTANERLPKLLKTPAEIHFVSIEPMLGSVAIDFYFLALNNKEGRSLDWIICGCESGPGARPFNEQWARSLRDQCIRQHIPFFFKQNRTQDGRFIEMPRLDGKIWNQIPRRSNRVT